MSPTNRTTAVTLPLIVALALTACSPHADQGVEKTNCTLVGQMVGAPPGDQAAMASKVLSAGSSGDHDLDAAMAHLADSLKGGSSVLADQAVAKVRAVCAGLGMWRTFH